MEKMLEQGLQAAVGTLGSGNRVLYGVDFGNVDVAGLEELWNEQRHTCEFYRSQTVWNHGTFCGDGLQRKFTLRI